MKKLMLIVASCLMLSVLPMQGGPDASVPTWGNALVEFSFDGRTGTYGLRDKRNGSTVIETASFQIDTYTSTQGYAYNWKAEPCSDELGRGQKISIEGKKAGQPTLILEAFLYDGKGFVALNLGIENTGDKELRITDFSPMKAVAYKGFVFDDYKTLDGENGVEITKVSSEKTCRTNNNLLVTFGKKGEPKRSLVIGGLTYNEFGKHASVTKLDGFLELSLDADDPIGKRVDAKSRYISKDKFYVDFTTDNRFEALENYGNALRLANRVDVSGVTIPILNFWYCFTPKYGGDEFRNNSVGMVYAMEQIVKSGFLRYSPVGLRLEPDDYALPNNEQGWWDDQHWQMYKGGQLLKPYETIVKWGGKIREMGGVPFIYCQTSKRSEDYCLQFPDQMLFNSPTAKRSKGPIGWWGREGDPTAVYWTYDFTDPGFIKHMQDVYKNLKKGGVRGIKFDYPETGWSYDGGFEDKYATTTSAYRNIFKLAYEGLGENRDVQERQAPSGDVALGVVTTQRTEGDNDRVYPGRISKTGLRWYKNRMVVNYDHDPINPYHVYPTNSRDGWRAAITMTATTSGRMEIGKYFEKMTGEMLHDLSRAIPLLDAPTLSARPADAFEGKPYPEIYNFTAAPGWNIVTFYNYRIEGETWPDSSGPYGAKDEQFIPKKMLPATIGISIGDRTDDGGLGLDPKKNYYVIDFWNWTFVGKLAGDARLEQTLRPGEARVMAVHEVMNVPQFLSTDRHLLQGYLDMTKHPEWNASRLELSAVSKLPADATYKVLIATNGYTIKKATAGRSDCEVRLFDAANSIYEVSMKSSATADVSWKVTFARNAGVQ